MGSFDQAQTSRLGQTLPPENPGIQIVTISTLPEVAYRGQIVYLSDLDYILIYDGSAWQPVGDSSGNVIYVQEADPTTTTTVNSGDQWYKPSTGAYTIWNGTAWVSILAAGSVGSTQLATGAVINGKIAVGAVTTDKLSVVVGGGNLLSNSYFKDTTALPTNFGSGSVVHEGATVYWNDSSVKLTATSGTNPFGFGITPVVSTSLGAVGGPQPNSTYTVSAWIRNPSGGLGVTSVGCLVSGTGVTVTSNVTSTVQGAWVRIYSTFTTGSSGTWSFTVNSNASPANGSVYYVGAIQLEVGDVPTAYAPKTDEIPPGTIVANMLQANIIDTTKLTATAIDGMTVTAPIIQTATSGQRMVISNDTSGGVIKYYTGNSHETSAGYINPGIVNTAPAVTIASPAASFYGARSRIDVVTSEIFYNADSHQFDGTITFNDNLNISATTTTDDLTVASPPTTTNAANVFIGGGGVIQKVTSLTKAKHSPKPIKMDRIRALLDVPLVDWYDSGERKANGNKVKGLKRIPGVLAEDVAAIDPGFATHDDDGSLMGVAYDRLGLIALPLIKELFARVEALEAERCTHDDH